MRPVGSGEHRQAGRALAVNSCLTANARWRRPSGLWSATAANGDGDEADLDRDGSSEAQIGCASGYEAADGGAPHRWRSVGADDQATHAVLRPLLVCSCARHAGELHV